jgi:drug/metabolite transporter (DMT)-like permease
MNLTNFPLYNRAIPPMKANAIQPLSAAGLRNLSSFAWKVVTAFAAVYLIWGSTYLGIRFAIETIPPFLMAGMRFVLAGGLLYAWTRARGAPRPTRRQWASAAVVGGLLLVGGNGTGVWAQLRHVPSGMVALLVATTPFWMTLIEWLRPGGVKPTGAVVAGLVVGFGGIVLLIGPQAAPGAGTDLFSMLLPVLAALLWSLGSIYSRGADLPRSPLMTTGIQMLAGGGMLLVVALLAGDWGRFNPAQVSARSLAAFVYLVTFGALVAFTAFSWLLRHVSPARVSTYAYVNPVIAVFLGWALAGEPLTPRTLVAAAIIVGAVAIIITFRERAATPGDVPEETP